MCSKICKETSNRLYQTETTTLARVYNQMTSCHTTQLQELREAITNVSGLATMFDTRRTSDYDAHKSVDAYLNDPDVREALRAEPHVSSMGDTRLTVEACVVQNLLGPTCRIKLQVVVLLEGVDCSLHPGGTVT
jgi:hypothetical protein